MAFCLTICLEWFKKRRIPGCCILYSQDAATGDLDGSVPLGPHLRISCWASESMNSSYFRRRDESDQNGSQVYNTWVLARYHRMLSLQPRDSATMLLRGTLQSSKVMHSDAWTLRTAYFGIVAAHSEQAIEITQEEDYLDFCWTMMTVLMPQIITHDVEDH